MHRFAALTLLASLPGFSPAFAKDPPPPNVILILADDHGYECLAANGGSSYKTPNLDKLAATGARFEHCYAQPLCTPTRVQLMTGQYNVRNYVRFGYIDPKLTTFAHLFKKAGYVTGVFGKWQLGHDVALPKQLGFDESYLWQHTRRPSRYVNPGLEINGKEMDYKNGEYGPDLVNDFAIDFVGRHKDKPFLLYYPLMLTHGPFQPPPDSPSYDPKAMTEQTGAAPKHFPDMVAYQDKLIGKLVAALDKHGVRERTLIVFTGDNGTGRPITSKLGDRTVRGGKGSTTEAGMRVPLIVNLPGKVKPGMVARDLVDSSDFLPTICDAAGIALPSDVKPDGRSFLPQARGEKGNPRQWYYCWYSQGGQTEKRQEFAATHRFKLYHDGRFYDLASDIEEQKPLKEEEAKGEAAAALKLLHSALEQYKDARPERLK